MANKQNNKKNIKVDETEVASPAEDLSRQQKAIESIVAGYGAGNSIPDLLKAILTELVKLRVGGGHV